MYCIFHLPRTGSRYLHSLINSSLSYLDPRHIGTELEPFNPATNTDESIKKKYIDCTTSIPPKTVKLTINHYPWLAEEFIQNPNYKTIFIKPQNYRNRLLKALVEKELGTFSNGTDRKYTRQQFIGKLSFSNELIEERFVNYKTHMEYEHLCDYMFYDEFIFHNSFDVMEVLNLTYVTPRYRHVPPYYSDIEMLKDINEFNTRYDKISMKLFGKIIC